MLMSFSIFSLNFVLEFTASATSSISSKATVLSQNASVVNLFLAVADLGVMVLYALPTPGNHYARTEREKYIEQKIVPLKHLEIERVLRYRNSLNWRD